MIKAYIERFNSFPSAVRSAIMFQILAWIWHYISLYTNLLKDEFPVSHLVIGGFLCFKLAQGRNWARKLCLCFNPPIILLYAGFTFLFASGSLKLTAICFLNVVLFSLATYFLFVKGAADFYKEEQKKDKILKAAQEAQRKANAPSQNDDIGENTPADHN